MTTANDRKSNTLYFLLGLSVLVLSLAVLAIAGFSYAYYSFDEKGPVSIPYKEFSFDEASVAEGEYMFLLSCTICHLDRNGQLGSHALNIVPAYIGHIRVPNLSRDPLYGISSLSDGELWHSLVTNIGADGRVLPMPVPAIPLTDKDLENIVLFLRYDDNIAAPVSTPSILSDYSPLGRMLSLVFTANRKGAQVRGDLKASGSRGAYLASSVMGCIVCHSPAIYQVSKSERFTGGNQIWYRSGALIETPALRGQKSVLQSYSFDSFSRLLKEGIGIDNNLVEMPLFPEVRETDLEQLWLYFVNLEETPQWKPGDSPDRTVKRLRTIEFGDCSACHNPSPSAGSDEYVAAHATATGQKKAYFRIHAPTFPSDRGW